MPLTWLLQHGGPAIRARVLRDLAPPGTHAAEAIVAAAQAAAESKTVAGLIRKQKETGLWGGNLLGLEASAADGIKEVGTVAQYRRLLQHGVPASLRPFKLADRVFYRILSRDEDPALLFEYAKLTEVEPTTAAWGRAQLREGAAAALAEAGQIEDPRLRGAAHRIADAISAFLRGPLVEQPFIKQGNTPVLHPEAHPPSWYSVAMIAIMPSLRRERAGFAERLGHYLAQPAPKKGFAVQFGKKTLKPNHLLLGDPIDADAKGNPKDLPLALHYIELLARMGALQWAPVASRVLTKLMSDCDAQGVWAPKGLKAMPEPGNPITAHYWPLADGKGAEARAADVTFRLALIARLLGWTLEYH